MTSPFIMAIKTNPDQFLAELETPELLALFEASVKILEIRAKTGDAKAGPALHSLYRALGEIEV